MSILDLARSEEQLIIQDTEDHVKSKRDILPIMLTMSSTSAYVCPEGTTEGKFLVGENVREVSRQVREYVRTLINPLLN